MKLSDAPSKLILPFANGGGKNVIPVPSSGTPGAASWTDGFPPATRTPITGGGVPPSGLDMNGILNAISAIGRWINAGAGFLYDPTFATDANIGGYPKGSRVLRADGLGYWISLVDDNLTDPDTGGAGWAQDGGERAVASVFLNPPQTVGVGLNKIVFNHVEYDPLSLWDAINARFVAPWDGKYRVSGVIFLDAPDAQNLGSMIYKNGILAKYGTQFPQVSDVDISLPFDAIISMVTGDYVEAYLNVTESPVTAGKTGTLLPQGYTFAQIEFLG